jgi:glycosyltransferase involved in cell wall biosynthesis
LSRYPDAIQRAQEQFLTWRLMKILFFSYTFAPNVGGIESVSAILAEKFAEAGHEVELVTETADKENAQPRKRRNGAGGSTLNPVKKETGRAAQRSIPDRNYRITRRPSFLKLIRLLSWCELVFQNNISLRSLIPALLMQKRVIVVHQTWLRQVRGGIGWNNRVKRVLLRFVTNVAISEATREDLGQAGDAPAPQFQMRVIGNPYDDGVFRLRPEIARDKALVFVGRLVSDKGVDLLLRALNVLRSFEENVQPASAVSASRTDSSRGEDGLRRGERPTPNPPPPCPPVGRTRPVARTGSAVASAQRPTTEEEQIKHRDDLQPDLTIIGVGPEEEKLCQLTRELGLDRQVTFAGEKSGEELAATLNRHQIMVVPSRWAEPFGIVALEGIACGCVVVGSRDGGLGEAIGPCGLTFKNGDERELADCLKALLLDPQRRAVFQKDASAHLVKFRAEGVANAYLQLIKEISH